MERGWPDFYALFRILKSAHDTG